MYASWRSRLLEYPYNLRVLAQAGFAAENRQKLAKILLMRAAKKLNVAHNPSLLAVFRFILSIFGKFEL